MLRLIPSLCLFALFPYAIESADNGDRIACYPLNGKIDCIIFILVIYFKFMSRIESQLNSTFCQSKGCVWDDTSGVKVKCYLPLDGAQSYGYELTSTPISTATGLSVGLRRRRLNGGTLPPSLYGGDVDEITFEVTYYSDQNLGFAVSVYEIFLNNQYLRT